SSVARSGYAPAHMDLAAVDSARRKRSRHGALPMARAATRAVSAPGLADLGKRRRRLRRSDVRSALQAPSAARRRPSSGHRATFSAGGLGTGNRAAHRGLLAPNTWEQRTMTSVVPVEAPDLTGKRRALVLTEDRVGHYPEFRDFFARVFQLDRIGLARPGYVSAPSGAIYELVFIGRSGEAFPCGLEINALIDALEPLDDNVVDSD